MNENLGETPEPGSDAKLCERLISIAALTKGQILEKRMEMRKSFVLARLSELAPGAVVEPEQVRADIQKATLCSLDEGSIFSSLDTLEEEGIVKHAGDKRFRLLKRVQLAPFAKIVEPVWDEFHSFLRRTRASYDPFLEKDARPYLEGLILRILSRVAMQGTRIPDQIELLPFEDFPALAESELKKYSLPGEYPKVVVGFLSESVAFREVFYSCYSGLMDIDLLCREQDMVGLDLTREIGLFVVDTTFLAAIMCKSDPAYPLARTVIRQCHSMGIEFCYTERTRAEMRSFVKASIGELTSILSDEGTGRTVGVVRSQFVEDFLRQDMTVNEYTSRLDIWEQLVESEFGIDQMPQAMEIDIDKEVYDYVMYVLPILDSVRNEERIKRGTGHIPRLRDSRQLAHDAYCLALVSSLRERPAQSASTANGPEWFLTFDNLLSSLDAARNRTVVLQGKGLVMQPRTVLNYMLVFSKVELTTPLKEETSEAIISYTIRAPRMALTVKEYGRLVTAKMGLQENDAQVIQDILLKSPLKDELAKALHNDQGTEAEAIAYRIVTDTPFTDKIIKERETRERLEESQERLKKVAAELVATRTDLERESAARKALERVLLRPISVNISAQLSVDVRNDLELLVALMDQQGAFKEGNLPRPDLTTKEKVIGWLRTIKETIETSKEISEGMKALLPLIGKVMGAL